MPNIYMIYSRSSCRPQTWRQRGTSAGCTWWIERRKEINWAVRCLEELRSWILLKLSLVQYVLFMLPSAGLTVWMLVWVNHELTGRTDETQPDWLDDLRAARLTDWCVMHDGSWLKNTCLTFHWLTLKEKVFVCFNHRDTGDKQTPPLCCKPCIVVVSEYFISSILVWLPLDLAILLWLKKTFLEAVKNISLSFQNKETFWGFNNL